jgi:hypothetical protein
MESRWHFKTMVSIWRPYSSFFPEIPKNRLDDPSLRLGSSRRFFGISIRFQFFPEIPKNRLDDPSERPHREKIVESRKVHTAIFCYLWSYNIIAENGRKSQHNLSTGQKKVPKVQFLQGSQNWKNLTGKMGSTWSQVDIIGINLMPSWLSLISTFRSGSVQL